MIGMTNPQQEKFYFEQNIKGDIIGLKDATGNEVKSYQYDPFGNQYKDTEKLSFQGVWEQETSQVYNPFGYCGEYFDEETGFVYLRGRYYDPATERFITEDPMKDGGNWYAYCGNDPVNRIDPSGYFMDGDDKYQGISNVYGAIAAATFKYKKAADNARLIKDKTSDTYANYLYEMQDAHQEADDARKLGDKILATANNARHAILDTAGLAPGVGALPDGLNTGLYALEGDWKNASLSGTATLPLGSFLAIIAKYGDKFLKAGDITLGGYKLTNHAAENAFKRGFTSGKIDNIISNYSQKVYQPGGQTVYAKKNGNYYDVVIVNLNNEVITVVGGNTNSLKTWKDVTKMLDNNGGYSSMPMN